MDETRPGGGVLRRAARTLCLAVAIVGVATLATEFSYAPTQRAYAPRPPAHFGEGESFQFVAYGDIEEENVGFGDLVQLLDNCADPDFGVVLGDVAKRDVRARESYIEFADVIERQRPLYPIYAVPGNHDRPTSGGPDEYVHTFGPLNWWFVHQNSLFIGLDNSAGMLTREARRTLDDAKHATGDARHVIALMHVPLFGDAVARHHEAVRKRGGEERTLALLRSSLGDLDLVLTGHADIWADDTDEHGTRHVCVGAQPGLGWPATESTPQLAALCSVTPDGIQVEQLRVPYRTELVASARQLVHLQLVLLVRRWLGPVPLWPVTLLAVVGWLVLRRRDR